MKKTLLSAVLALASVAASASVTGFTTYDANNFAGSKTKTHEVNVGAAMSTVYGTFDLAGVYNQVDTGARDHQAGFEVGYSNGIKLGQFNLTGRAALGRNNFVAGENTQFYSLAGELSVPLTSGAVTGFVGYRHRNYFNVDGVENRYSVGADIAVTKKLDVRVGYAHTTFGGDVKANGVVTAVSYKF